MIDNKMHDKMRGREDDEINDRAPDHYHHHDDNMYRCTCECCHCKKIFMSLVILILVFIAGIMVGNCGSYRYMEAFYSGRPYQMQKGDKFQHNQNKKFHRGAQEIPSSAPRAQQTGGFVATPN